MNNVAEVEVSRLANRIGLSIVIPAYNEAERIVPTLKAIQTYMQTTPMVWELLVVDDGSTDDTVAVVRETGQKINCSQLRVLVADKNGGKGSAVQRGLKAAVGQHILFTDADNSTSIEQVETLLSELKESGHDVVIGSRSAKGSNVANKSILRHTVTFVLYLIVRIALGLGVKDTQCGFKLFTHKAAKRLARQQTLKGFSFDLELLFLARLMRYSVAELPVRWVDVDGSKVDVKREIGRFLCDIGKIRLNQWRGTYNEATPDQLRVALVTAFPPSMGSLNEYAYHFVRHMRQNSGVREITLLTDELDASAAVQLLNADKGAPTRVLPTWKFDAWSNPFRIVWALWKTRPDVVLFNMQFATFGGGMIAGGLGLLTPLLARLGGVKTAVLLHNLVETVDFETAGYASSPVKAKFMELAGTVMTRIILCADMVALTIPKYVRILRQKYSARNVHHLPHGSFADHLATPSFALPSGARQIMTFGKFGTYKQVDKLIEAFDQLQAETDEPLELVIAGGNNPKAPDYLETMQADYSHVANVRFTGYVAEEDVPQLFEDAAVVVFPYTSTTGSSGVLHQAGDYGKAVVLPRLGDFVDLITDEGFVGEVFNPECIDSLAGAIETLLQDDERREAMGWQNYQAAKGLPMSDVVNGYVTRFNGMVWGETAETPTTTAIPALTPALSS